MRTIADRRWSGYTELHENRSLHLHLSRHRPGSLPGADRRPDADGRYVFRSLTLKGIERRLDGLYEPQEHEGPVYVVEFQAQPAAGAWYNLLTKIGLYGEEHPDRDVQGLLIGLREEDFPRWPSRVGEPDAVATAVCLERFLPQWLEREPDNPFVAALAPLILTRDEDLRDRAPRLWRTIQERRSRRRCARRSRDSGVLVVRTVSARSLKRRFGPC